MLGCEANNNPWDSAPTSMQINYLISNNRS